MIWPKPYLSYTQRQLWKRSPDKYIELYWRNGQRYTSREMAYGKVMADAIEKDEDTGDPMLDLVIELLPKLDQAEYELKCELKVGSEHVPLYGKLDHAKLDLSAFREYKTGKTKWSQFIVDRDDQITWYATLIYIITGKVPSDIALCHAPTIDTESGPRATGEVFTYKTYRSYSQILSMMVDMRRVWKEIGERCEQEML